MGAGIILSTLESDRDKSCLSTKKGRMWGSRGSTMGCFGSVNDACVWARAGVSVGSGECGFGEGHVRAWGMDQHEM